MKERSKERMAELLLEELFAQAAEREDIKRMLGELTALPLDEVIGGLVEDLAAAIAKRRLDAEEFLRAASARPSPAPPQAEPRVEPAPPVATPEEPRPEPSPAPAVSKAETVPVTAPPAPEAVPAPAATVLARDVSTAPASEKMKPAAKAPEPPPKSAPPPESPAGPPDVPQVRTQDAFWGKLEAELRRETPAGDTPAPEEEAEFKGTLKEADAEARHTATEFTDSDIVYLHAVAFIPENENPSSHPFMLEEKGIDGRSFAFAFDYEGMRFYLSRITPTGMNVSKTGMLLLGKQESVEAIGNHESVLNDLRLHGILLPFAFGTLARGRDEFMSMVDRARNELTEALEEMAATRWWVLRLHALDARIVQIVGKEEPAPARKGRTVERVSYTKIPQPKKFDIKVLERILNKEKRLAESVHEELKNVAERSDIDMIVGLGSGSSEDWKLILEASYEMRPGSLQKFFHAIADLQYRHITLDLMFAVAGSREPFTFAAG